MILLTFALKEESRDLISALRDVSAATESRGLEKSEFPDLSAVRGTMGGYRVLIVHTGVGQALTRTRLEQLPRLWRNEPVECLITAGFAGGLDPELSPGALILGENYSDPERLQVAQAALGSRATGGILVTTETAVETPEAKAALRKQTGGIAVDMETAATAAFCQKHGLPMLSLRAITDSASEPLPVPFPVWFDEATQQPRPLALLRYLALHPSQILRFVRFVGGVNRARTALTEALVDVVARLGR